jgi:hypothetical protein
MKTQSNCTPLKQVSNLHTGTQRQMVYSKVEVDDFYDDKVRIQYVFHFLSGVARSRSISLHRNTEDPNIQQVQVKGKENSVDYQWSFRNPFTGEANAW